MRIFEVTQHTLSEQNPFSSFAKGFGRGLMQKVGLPTGVQGNKGQTRALLSDPQGLQKQTLASMGPQIQALGKNLNQVWISRMLERMQQQGVASIRMIDDNEKRDIIEREVNNMLSRLTGGRASDYRQLSSSVAVGSTGLGKVNADAITNNMESRINEIIALEPRDPASQQRLATAWTTLSTELYKASLLASLEPETRISGGFAQNTQGQLTYNNTPLFDRQSQPIMVGTIIYQQVANVLKNLTGGVIPPLLYDMNMQPVRVIPQHIAGLP